MLLQDASIVRDSQTNGGLHAGPLAPAGDKKHAVDAAFCTVEDW